MRTMTRMIDLIDRLVGSRAVRRMRDNTLPDTDPLLAQPLAQ
jgi:hypothetical protein